MKLTQKFTPKQTRKALAAALQTRDVSVIWYAFNKWRHEMTDYEHKYRVVAKNDTEYKRLVGVVAQAALDLNLSPEWNEVVAKWQKTKA